MLCNKCYRHGKKVEMIRGTNVKPRSLESKGAMLNVFTGEIEGKPMYVCSECGYTRYGRGNSESDLREGTLNE